LEYVARIHDPDYHILILFSNESSNPLSHKVEVVDLIAVSIESLCCSRNPRLKHGGDPSDEIAITKFGEKGELSELALVYDHHELHFETGWQVFRYILEIVISFICIDIQSVSDALDQCIRNRIVHSQPVKLIYTLLQESFSCVVGR